jgi:hypothetical protein
MTLTPEQVVQQNLDGYNNRDIDCFMLSFSDEIALFEFGQPEPITKGKTAIRDRYLKLFNQSPNLHSDILTRTVFGNVIIDHERIAGRNGSSDILELVMIYEVEGEKIVRMTTIRKS